MWGSSVPASLAASSASSVRAVRTRRLVAAGGGAPAPATLTLAYTQPCGCVRVRSVYEATEMPALRILPNGSLPERSAPPVRKLQPRLYPAAHEEAPWA